MSAPEEERDMCGKEGPYDARCSEHWLHQASHRDVAKDRSWQDGWEERTPPEGGGWFTGAPEGETPATIASDVEGVGHIPVPEGMPLPQWHQDGAEDTQTSHKLVGRVYAVQCLWCPEVFIGNTKADAVILFKIHERAMLDLAAESAP